MLAVKDHLKRAAGLPGPPPSGCVILYTWWQWERYLEMTIDMARISRQSEAWLEEMMERLESE